MNEEMKASDLLRAAARLIDKAIAQLDPKEGTCDRCGHREFGNKPVAKVLEQLVDQPAKLRQQAARLETYADVGH